MHPRSSSQQHQPPSGSCTASLLSCPWNPSTDNMQPGQHRGWSCRDMHTAVVLYLCLSVHTERAKRGEKKPEINIKGRSEAMNSTYVTISKDRETSDFAQCFLWLTFTLLIYSRNDAVMVSILKPGSLKSELTNLKFIALKIKIWEEITLDLHCNITSKTIPTQLPPDSKSIPH